MLCCCGFQDMASLLVCVLHSLSFVVSECGFCHDSDDPEPPDEVPLLLLLCFSEAELDRALSFSLPLSSLSLPSSSLDVSVSYRHRHFLWLNFAQFVWLDFSLTDNSLLDLFRGCRE